MAQPLDKAHFEALMAQAGLDLTEAEKEGIRAASAHTQAAAARERVAADKGIRALVLTGAGKGFSAGGDIAGMEQRMSAPTGEIAFNGWHRQLRVHRTQTLLHTMPKPVIAAVSGFALGGGCELAMLCDFIIAADNAKFGQPEVKLGLLPGGGAPEQLAAQMKEDYTRWEKVIREAGIKIE